MILILTGRSGSGKTAIAKELVENHGYEKAVICTTSELREGEVLDRDYRFLTQEQFLNHVLANDFVEWNMYGGDLYGMLNSSLETDARLVCILTPEGADAVKGKFPDAFIVYVDPGMKTAVIRMLSREKELTPGMLRKIYIRALQDHYLFDHPYCDLRVENGSGSVIEDTARHIAEAHAAYPYIPDGMKELRDVLREGLEALETFKKKGGGGICIKKG